MKKNKIYFPLFIMMLASVSIYFGCSEEVINRDYFPIIKKNLYKLQVAVKNQNLAQIDSLMSVKVIEKKQSSDSLIRFVNGNNNEFSFVQFGFAEIVYTNENARIDCFVMDSTSSRERPIVFFLHYEHEMWLFTGFGEKSKIDSLQLN